ncbi:DUF4190 domain-containing protein [Candidatus Pacearchaeota archaeon]|nr:DUF4190 domain-containing protein [Candidatus Pacearchaeota archaeon]
MSNKKENNHISGLAIASLILGLVSFIPLVGALLGTIAFILGTVALFQIKKSRIGGRGFAIAGIILGFVGVLFTVLLYGSLFYFGFVAENGPFKESKIELSKMILTQNAGQLELYKKKYGNYPPTLEEMNEARYTVYLSDHFIKPFFYEVSEDGQSYVLKSVGPDKEIGTSDDIFPNNK